MEGIEVIIHTNGGVLAPSSPIPPSRETSESEPWKTSMAIIAATSPEIKALNLPRTPSFPEPIPCSRSLSFSFPVAQSFSEEVPGPAIPKPDLMIRSQSEYLPRKSFLSQEPDHEDNKENIHPNSKLTIDTRLAACEGNHPPRKGRHRRASFASLPSPAEISPTVGNDKGRRHGTKWKGFSHDSPVGVDDFPFPPSPPHAPPISSLPKTIPAAYASTDPVPSMRMKLKGLNLRTGFR
eukprot:Nitzschia sp. Nitz4//scaffold455_size6260//1007//1717//NITZ4_009181-RA/size6260-processed-gene-0.0-mRNA-1//-1//CDS//3329552298//3262//frame0